MISCLFRRPRSQELVGQLYGCFIAFGATGAEATQAKPSRGPRYRPQTRWKPSTGERSVINSVTREMRLCSSPTSSLSGSAIDSLAPALKHSYNCLQVARMLCFSQ